MRDLRTTQEAFVALCLDERPPEDLSELASEHERGRLMLYRDMVRWRFHQITGEVLPRTRTAIGEERFRAHVDRWITEAKPRSRFFRDLPLHFADFVLSLPGALAPLPRDILRLERARWAATIAPDAPSTPAPFSLEAVPHPAPSLTVFDVDHRVHLGGDDGPGRVHLAVYRRPDFEVETRWSSPLLQRLLLGWSKGERPAIETVRAVLAEDQRAPTPAFVEEMTTFLSELLDRGAILGSRR